MSKTRDDLLQAILREPDCDVVRLAFADCCVEEGDEERAEFIRVQIESVSVKSEVAALGPCYCSGPDPTGCGRCRKGEKLGLWRRRERLAKRERELLDSEAANAWFDFPAYVREWWARRGFVQKISLSAEDWIAHADALLAAQPIREVVLTTWPDVADTEVFNEAVTGHACVRLKGRAVALPLTLGHNFTRWMNDLFAATWDGIKFTLPPEDFRAVSDRHERQHSLGLPMSRRDIERVYGRTAPIEPEEVT